MLSVIRASGFFSRIHSSRNLAISFVKGTTESQEAWREVIEQINNLIFTTQREPLPSHLLRELYELSPYRSTTEQAAYFLWQFAFNSQIISASYRYEMVLDKKEGLKDVIPIGNDTAINFALTHLQRMVEIQRRNSQVS